MRRLDKKLRGSVCIRVCFRCGTYIATGGGQRTSCTSGPQPAAERHALKVLGGKPFNLTPLAEANTWRATTIQEAI